MLEGDEEEFYDSTVSKYQRIFKNWFDILTIDGLTFIGPTDDAFNFQDNAKDHFGYYVE